MRVPGAASRILARILVRLAVAAGMDLTAHEASLTADGWARQEFGSLAPMSMVISETRPRCARRNAAAAASCDPPRYRQIPPLIMLAVVSPLQPSLTRRRPGSGRRRAA